MAPKMTYEKGMALQISLNFKSTEFDCQCKRPECDLTTVDPELVAALEALRLVIGPILITSGYRCPAHNKEIGGMDHSYHLRGMAADIKSTKFPSGHDLANQAEQVTEFKNGGIGQAQDWVHLDIRETAGRWYYPLRDRMPC